jgi:glyoxylase-like metal-dependent hydrolase (beta-lactamase superfamily II)
LLQTESHGDVSRLELSSWTGRRLGYTVSVYRIGDLLIDTGFPHIADRVAAWAVGERIRGAIVTHWHEDHSGGATALAARGIALALHPETERRLREPKRLELYRRATWGSFQPLRGEIARFTPNALQIIAAPGHSVDHHVVWEPLTGTMFAGDLFLGVKVRIAHETEDLAEQIVSLRRCAAMDPARFFCGHRGLVPNAASTLRAKADWMEETVALIGRRTSEGWDDARIVRDVLGGEELTGRASFGHYSRAAFVRAARRAAAQPRTASNTLLV